MKYYRSKGVIPKDKESEITALDRAILQRTSRNSGSDVFSVISCGKPFMNKFGTKEFASRDIILKHISKLVKMGLVERR